MRIGLFGGSFDPIHAGHLFVGQEAVSQLGLERLLVIPTSRPPHKQDRRLTPIHHRLELVRRAIAGLDRFELAGVESGAATSYTIDTVRWARSAFPEAELYLVIGSDSLADLDLWRSPDEIQALATLAVYEREGYPLAPTARPHVLLRGAVVLVSSSEIRERIAAGRSVRDWVPDAVMAYIDEHDLYRGEIPA
jgi:nicotinate-nucleotide adenylyltransferase